ncbi:T9SS type A sorting domain-containing protein [uncultured Flavobacterium sp.]|uniref:T9SS type A sorting domain-containing protein n=1 Tax=uncultured Flavobacterium sp. TaxID=165435 RepID=UPI0030EF11CA|tara:strand:+ start:40108 stop:42744 length:2637 start_codon:yes stop_codon:yes gene_type:complete
MKNLFFYLVLFFTAITNAQTVAELDLTFNNNSALSGNGEGPIKYGFVTAAALQTDGKTIVAGSFTSYNGTPCNGLIRLNVDGSQDNSFVISTLSNSNIKSINIQPDGKIIIAGSFQYLNGNSGANYSDIARLNTDGSTDLTFNSTIVNTVGGVSGSIINSSIILPNGKIIICGNFTTYNNINAYRIARLNTDGTLDTSFNISGLGAQYGITNYNSETDIKSLKLQPDGKIIVIGNFTAFNSTVRNHIARLNSDGTIDLSFNSEIGLSFQSNEYIKANSISIQPDNKIIVGGQFITYNNSPAKGLVRINSDGSIDNTFNVGNGFILQGNLVTGNTYIYPGEVIKTEIQPDGKIIVGGDFIKIDQTLIRNLARLNTDGSLDLTFNNFSGPSNIFFPPSSGNITGKISTLFLDNQNIFIGGSFDFYNYTHIGSFTKLNSNGTVDFDFNKNNGPNHTVKCTKIQSDGKIIIGGIFTRYNGADTKAIVRVNEDGSIDQSFNIGSGAVANTNIQARNFSYINSIIIQSDNKIIAAGHFDFFNNTAKSSIVRLNADGSVDNTFNPILPLYTNSINKIILQSDGKIIVKSNNTLFRLNSDGSNDNSFNHITINSSYSNQNSVILKNDGKIIYTDGNSIKRLNANGSIDTTFNIVSVCCVFSIEVNSDDKLIIAGDFSSVNNVSVYKIARLNPNGTLDVTFYPNGFYCDKILTTKILSNGKILLGCYGNSSQTIQSLILLNSNGSFDSNFNIGTGFAFASIDAEHSIYDINIQDDNKILVGGSFTAYNGVNQNRILRLNNSGSLTNDLFNSSNEISLFPNPTNHLLNIDVPDNFEIKSINIINQIGQTVINQNENYKTIDVSTLSNGIYFIKINGENGTITKQFIKN